MHKLYATKSCLSPRPSRAGDSGGENPSRPRRRSTFPTSQSRQRAGKAAVRPNNSTASTSARRGQRKPTRYSAATTRGDGEAAWGGGESGSSEAGSGPPTPRSGRSRWLGASAAMRRRRNSPGAAAARRRCGSLRAAATAAHGGLERRTRWRRHEAATRRRSGCPRTRWRLSGPKEVTACCRRPQPAEMEANGDSGAGVGWRGG